MRISRVTIKNFRNFEHLDVSIGEHAVIVGENKVGKTNFLFALRLILDPSLPDSMRRLRMEDFWDGLPRPLSAHDQIEISVEFSDFEDNGEILAVLADHLVKPDPMVAGITFCYRPLPGLETIPSSEADYEFLMFGGNRTDNPVGYDLRRWLPMDIFHALRDAESDLNRWSRSPLRPLLERASKNVDKEALNALAVDVQNATAKIAEIPELAAVVTQVNEQLVTMVGEHQNLETTLGFAPTEAERLIRALQLMIDGGVRGVSEASLGSANVLYLALKQLEHDYLVQKGERQHTFLAIEEPEAHLHPHLQRRIYRNYLRTRDEGENPDENPVKQTRSILLTTHSPNVSSVAPLNNIVVLRSEGSPRRTVGRSLRGMELEDAEADDLERFIDVTRGEIFFSKAVILVEGDSEKFLLPTLAKMHDPSFDFDSHGVTICSIGGTNFAPYIKLLRQEGLDCPFVLLTDFDPADSPESQEDDDPDAPGVRHSKSYGKNRVVNHIASHLMPSDAYEATDFAGVINLAPSLGVFLNDFTFEVDLFHAGAAESFSEAIDELTTNSKMKSRFSLWSWDLAEFDSQQFLKDVESLGKGRVAQRLASVLAKKNIDCCPQYIKDALDFLKLQLS